MESSNQRTTRSGRGYSLYSNFVRGADLGATSGPTRNDARCEAVDEMLHEESIDNAKPIVKTMAQSRIADQ